VEYGHLRIGTIVMHEIVNKALENETPVQSDVPAQMDDNQRLFIQERMRNTLGGSARPIVEDEAGAVLPPQVKKYLHDADADLVPLSKDLATLLQDVQPTASPAGLFLACACTMADSRALLIAKLEHQRGVRAPHTKLSNGNITFTIESINDLLFTSKSKIYKVALFVEPEIDAGLTGTVVDRQMTGSSIAQYFMVDFLGCRLAERADLYTQRFFQGAQKFIDEVEDPQRKARYEVSLLSEMQRNTNTLSIDAFASDYLLDDDKDDFVAFMGDRSIPSREFDKDTTLIKSHLMRVKVDFERGVTVLAPPDEMEDGTVSLTTNADDVSTITIRDKIAKLSGAGTLSLPTSRETASVDN
jgi:hypothetical protein